eukprot:scaffold58_cov376-Prasinococcus_capsulatus_cf.AAC.3
MRRRRVGHGARAHWWTDSADGWPSLGALLRRSRGGDGRCASWSSPPSGRAACGDARVAGTPRTLSGPGVADLKLLPLCLHTGRATAASIAATAIPFAD